VKLKEAVSIAPNSVKAHSEYIRIKSYWQDKELEVQAEYEKLMKKDPENPVYPLALAPGQSFALPDVYTKWFEKVAQLSPDTTWARYAKARTIEKENPDLGFDEYLKGIAKDPTERFFYISAFPILCGRNRKSSKN